MIDFMNFTIHTVIIWNPTMQIRIDDIIRLNNKIGLKKSSNFLENLEINYKYDLKIII